MPKKRASRGRSKGGKVGSSGTVSCSPSAELWFLETKLRK